MVGLRNLQAILPRYDLENKPLKNVEQCPPILLPHISLGELLRNAVPLMIFLKSQSHFSIFTVSQLLP